MFADSLDGRRDGSMTSTQCEDTGEPLFWLWNVSFKQALQVVLTALCFEGQAGFGFEDREHLAGVPKEGKDPGKRKQEQRGKSG